MKTSQDYYANPYAVEIESRVLAIQPQETVTNIILDKTLFYPEGGGQPSDRGMIGNDKIEYVRIIDGELIHQTKHSSLKEGDIVKATIDWSWRYKYMKIHTAGHLLHDVLMTIVSTIIPIRGGHGKKAFLEYKGEIDVSIKDKLEEEVNLVAQRGLDIKTKQSSFEELSQECSFLPHHLPKDKPLRMIKIGEYPAMPDGGVHVNNTNELGKIWIANITNLNGIANIRYGVVVK